MKIMCQCGRDVRYEPPFDDFHTERVPCTATCVRIKALEQTPPAERLTMVFPRPQFGTPVVPVAMAGH
jgi:hypothetical protein